MRRGQQPTPGAKELPKSASFRPDIQGLRAVAVGVVLLFHANWSFFRGGFVGVDIFFVISGFLITGLLLREAQNTGHIRLGDFYAKRARRILPAATVVLLATLVLTVVFLPQIRWESIGIEALASAVYVVNWVFAAGTDYLNAEVAASPLQHFWTLAVEEQFYIVWPLILVALLALVRRRARKSAAREGATADRRVSAMRAARVGVLMILVPSLLFSIYYTGAEPETAYFVTTTRLWELAIGAALAVFAPQVARIPHWLGYALGWAGLAAIVAATLLFSGAMPFPGSAALVPTLGAAAIIAAGMNGRAETGVGRLLTLKPMRWIGDISYSLYLWHWPLIVVGTYLLGGDLRVRYGLLIVAFAVLPAWLSYRFIENPFRDWHWVKRSSRRSLLAGAGLMAATAVVASVVFVAPATLNPERAVAADEKVGAEALTDDFSDDDLASFTDAGKPVDVVEGGFTPSAITARADNTVVYALDCHLGSPPATPKIEGCIFGDPDGEVSVVLIGDSHAANWAPPYIALAEKHGWRLRITSKASCGFSHGSQADRNGGEYTSCNEWSATSFDQILAERPDLVVTANRATRAAWQEGVSRAEARSLYADGLHENLRLLNEAGIPTLVMNATPRMTSDVPECISANPDHLTACATPRNVAFGTGSRYVERAVKGLSDADVIDMGNWVCPDAEACAAVVGNVVVWRDSAHFTETYARTLAKPLEAQLRQSALADDVLW
ncbi:Acyltransferase 3 [uncultured Microbacterium sp.]|uniref:Acyltransferase 3 n=1 Tax=uncultured Microbacterium sp. TaxID=191216 RepID=A0A1Y5P6N1_9MICO|nr:Acyltransferase 3 [uncultured Microbacterium sp.]